MSTGYHPQYGYRHVSRVTFVMSVIISWLSVMDTTVVSSA